VSRFHGKCHEGYLKEVRFERRREAYERILKQRDVVVGPHTFVLTALVGGELIFLCEGEGCTQRWNPSIRHHVPTSPCPWVKKVKPSDKRKHNEKQKRHQISSS